MQEITKIPIPLLNYVNLIQEKRDPYFQVVLHLLTELEHHYEKSGRSETVYTINPRSLCEELKKKVKDKKLTVINVCRSILALVYSCNLRENEDFFVTITSGGRKNYHIRVNEKTLSSLQKFLF